MVAGGTSGGAHCGYRAPMTAYQSLDTYNAEACI